MNKNLTHKDYILISAYLDGELSTAQKADVEKHLQINSNFKHAIEEMAYTKRVLAALPRVRAPRNFTLTPDRVKKTAKIQRFQPAWGMVSAFSTLILLVIFASSRLAPLASPMRAAAPVMATEAADNAFSAEKVANEVTPTPMIILWNPPRAYGMGGGGGGAEGSGITAGGMGGGPVTSSPTESPAPLAAVPQATLDPSYLILGIPDTVSQEQTLIHDTEPRSNWLASITTSTWLMIGAGLLALVSALLAIFTRRR
ncbi:MAG TPA: zf-HC2 domain-containing protein [Anaerolineaceae bacterium]|nr:zf-HC2 domain-containing protein [Anaerolineaceae bacterium]